VFEGCVQVSLLSQTHNLREMRVIDVGIDSEQTLEDVLHNRHKTLWKAHAFEEEEEEEEEKKKRGKRRID
jgi:hypothetical protein